MIGIDVVWINSHFQSSLRQERILDRICTPTEKEKIVNGGYNHLHFLLIWSLKESAYKADRGKGSKAFNPKRYQTNIDMLSLKKHASQDEFIDYCSDNNNAGNIIMSTVNSVSGKLMSRSLITDKFVFSTCYELSVRFDHIKWKIILSDSLEYLDYSRELKEYFLEDLSKTYQIGINRIKIIKSPELNFMPQLLIDDSPSGIYISFSHDVPILSFAYFDQGLNVKS